MYEQVHIGFLRRWATNECLEQIKGDDQFTKCISIGPVSYDSELSDWLTEVNIWCLLDLQGNSDAC